MYKRQILHIVDLDATLGTGENFKTIKQISKNVSIPLQVAGGLRTEEKIPVLGICLGMEMFFKQSQQGKEKGVDVMNGEVVILPNDMKIPHMGWNSLEITKDSKILEGVKNNSWVYFVHSYRAKPDNPDLVVANADYGIKVPAVVEDKLFFGTQFHPEKSGKVGSLMIQNFLRVCSK